MGGRYDAFGAFVSIAATALCFLQIVPVSSLSAEEKSGNIQAVLIHPPYSASYSCSEHWYGQLQYPGDALGSDCTIQKMVEEGGRKWMRSYSDDGRQNKDWFGWRAAVLAPCNCTVAKVHINPETNAPGVLGEPPSSSITFVRPDGVRILVAHIAEPVVEVGDAVVSGQPVAKVGNNGYSRQPHVHIGAWRDEQPFQLRFDQTRMGPASRSD